MESEWKSRGYLPHRDRKLLVQSVTFRLADSLPQSILRRLQVELERLPDNERESWRRQEIEKWLDAGIGCCALKHPEFAVEMVNSLKHFDGERYHLIAWCVMPNHVHVLIEAIAPLPKTVQGWKSFTARWAITKNSELDLQIPNRRQLWMREYWDRFIRDSAHLNNIVNYIEQNPVKAGLRQEATEWPYSSARCQRSVKERYFALFEGRTTAPEIE
jgi:REP element-mobilizing transposase RayT